MNASDVTRFARCLAAFPLDTSDVPSLIGGVFMPGGGRFEEHVGIEVRPIGSLGQVGIEVRLAQPWPPDAPRPRASVTLEVRTTYEALQTLSSDLTEVVSGGRAEAHRAGEMLAGSPRP